MEEDFLYNLLRRFAFTLKSVRVGLMEFTAFVEDYAKVHVTEDTDLMAYWTDSISLVKKGLEDMEKRHLVHLIRNHPETSVIVFEYLISTITKTYRKMQTAANVAFPGFSSLPRYLPASLFEKRKAPQFFYDLLGKVNIRSEAIYVIEWPQSAPAIVYPGVLEPGMILQPALFKIKEMLAQEKHQSFLNKKLTQSDPGKQSQVKRFFDQILENADTSFGALEKNLSTYWLWSQLCYTIRNNVTEMDNGGKDDNSILQSVMILDAFASFYKQRSDQEQAKAKGREELEANFCRPPYYYTFGAIKKFTDDPGTPLLTLYTEKELIEFLHSDEMYSFTVDVDLRKDVKYFILKKNIISLVNRLRGDAGRAVQYRLVNSCMVTMGHYGSTEAYQNPGLFSQKVEGELKKYSPLFYSLLVAPNFALVYTHEMQQREAGEKKIPLTTNEGRLVSFGEIFGFTPESILAEARQALPFWYKLPIVSFFYRLAHLIAAKLGHPLPGPGEISVGKIEPGHFQMPIKAGEEWRQKLRDEVTRVLADLVPAESTLVHELTLYEQQWNPLRSLEAHKKLTDDVNLLAQDYIKRSLKSFQHSDFSKVRLRKMAESLSASPALIKIDAKEELTMYIQLFLLRILRNF